MHVLVKPRSMPLLLSCSTSLPATTSTARARAPLSILDPADPRLQVEVPANTALVVCREKGGILNILLAPLGEQGSHTR